MITVLRKIFNPKVRTIIYGLSVVIHPVVLTYYSISENTWSLWVTGILGLVDAVIAFLNTPVINQHITETPPAPSA